MLHENFFSTKKYGTCPAPAKTIETMFGKMKVGQGEHYFTKQGIGVLKCRKCGIIQVEIK